MQCYGHVLAAGFRLRLSDHVRINVHADNARRRKFVFEKRKGSAIAASCIEDCGIRVFSVGDEPLQIGERVRQNMHRPGFGPQEPNSESRFGDVRMLGRQISQLAHLARDTLAASAVQDNVASSGIDTATDANARIRMRRLEG